IDCAACATRGVKVVRFEQACGACSGTGFELCGRCWGRGEVSKKLRLTLRVPPKVESGAWYRYPGAGFTYASDDPGDLLVRFQVALPPVRRRRRRRRYGYYY